MNTVRTKISVIESKLFRIFLDANDMSEIIVGDYDLRESEYQVSKYICYAYSDKFEDAIANMTYIVVKYGGIETAFKDYVNKVRVAGGFYA